MYGCSKDCLILIPFRLAQISCFTLSLKCLSSNPDSCPNMGIRPLLQFPHPLRAGPVLLTLLFFPLVPSSSRVLRGSIYSFPLVRYSCPLSAGLLALLCLKVCSCFIHGERCTPCPPIPLPSCSPLSGYSFTFAYLFCMLLPITLLFGTEYLLTTTKSIIFCPSTLFLL